MFQFNIFLTNTLLTNPCNVLRMFVSIVTLNCLVHTSFLDLPNSLGILKKYKLRSKPILRTVVHVYLLPSTYILGPQLLGLRQTSWNRSSGGIPGHEEQFVKVHIDGWQSSTCQLVTHSPSFTTSRDHESSFVSIIFRKWSYNIKHIDMTC